MIYLSLDTYGIKILSLSKTLFGQYTASYFQKKHTTQLLLKGNIMTIDVVASAVKEALTMATPSPIREKEVCLILPQESFEFFRYPVPHDISDAAIKPFIEDKIRAQSDFSLDGVFYDYLLVRQQDESAILFFAQRTEIFAHYYEVLHLLGLSIEYLVPETLSFFTLFAKTLRKDKRENILYLFYHGKDSYGYVYDSLGLLKNEKYHFDEPIEDSLHTMTTSLSQDHIKLNRLILSGTQSEKIRQDTFTKKVGVWTNPLKKIIPNFYQDYVRLFSFTDQQFPLLDFDVCIGAFIALCEHTAFSVKTMTRTNGKKMKQNIQIKNPFIFFSAIRLRDIIIFFISFLISFILIFSFLSLKDNKNFSLTNQSSQKPTSVPPSIITPTATPTPSPIVWDKKTLKIKVLNGGGTKGKAGEVKDILLNKGYEDILTGNADNFEYEKTEIQITDEKKDMFLTLQKDLDEFVTVEKSAVLDTSSSADVILIIGKDFK